MGSTNRPVSVVFKDIAIGNGGLGFDSQAGTHFYVMYL